MARRVLCSRCGKIHEYGRCTIPARKKSPTKNAAFRSSHAWTEKSKQIRTRDNFLCQVCLHSLDGGGVKHTSEDLEVHHIEKLENDFDLRLDDDNLITLCAFHHEKAEAGLIDARKMREVATANGKLIPPGG